MPTQTTSCHRALQPLLFFFAANAAAASYTNHTVGGAAGWFFNASTNSSAADYSNWAASQTFDLGDFLVFNTNTNTNTTVVQTYNQTTYNSCSADYASDTDTFINDTGATTFGQQDTISVPLTIQGPNYFFSDAGDDGVQCEHGMRFKIVVNHGSGLPPSLNQPPPPPYTAPPTSQPPPVFEGGGGGQGESINGGWARHGGGFSTVMPVGLGLFGVWMLG
ncbi:Early nodulin-like protein [Drosera capensis]